MQCAPWTEHLVSAIHNRARASRSTDFNRLIPLIVQQESPQRGGSFILDSSAKLNVLCHAPMHDHALLLALILLL